MKKINLFSFLFLVYILSTNSLIAQVKFGVNAGLNSSRVQNKYYIDKNPDNSSFLNFGIKIGVSFEFKINPKLYIQAGLNYDQKPIEYEEISEIIPYVLPGYEYNILIQKDKNKLTPQYLEIPVNIKYVFLSKFKNKLSVIVGPYIAFGIAGESIYEEYFSSKLITRKRKDIKFGNSAGDDFSPIDIGLNAGLEYNFSKFQLKLVYQQGLSNLYPSYITNGIPYLSQKNTNISLSFGYYIF